MKTIEEILAALSILVAGTTDDEARAALLSTLGESLQPLGFVAESGVQALIDSQISGLKTKNGQLIGADKKLRDELQTLAALRDDHENLVNMLTDFGIELDKDGKLDETKVEQFLETRSGKSGEAAGDTIKLEREVRRIERERQKLERKVKDTEALMAQTTAKLQDTESFVNTILVDRELEQSLYKNGFEKLQVGYLLPALKLQSKAVVEIDEITGERKAITDDGKAVGEWVDWFATTDEGKALKPAPKNHGGSSPGSNNSRTGTVKPWAEMTGGERARLAKENPTKYHQLRDSARV